MDPDLGTGSCESHNIIQMVMFQIHALRRMSHIYVKFVVVLLARNVPNVRCRGL